MTPNSQPAAPPPLTNQPLSYELAHTRKRYREIFGAANTMLEEACLALRSQFACPQCEANGTVPTLFDKLHEGCGYAHWVISCQTLINQQIGRQIYAQLQAIEVEKKKIACGQCGVCCRFASSEFTYDQLREKAANGDAFAAQFTSIFLPYASMKAAHQRFPQLVEAVLKEVDDPESVSFYHCPYVGEDNRCTIYGTSKRPAICDSYPDTPLTFIYDGCHWKPWKDANHDEALTAHASIELCSFYLDKLSSMLPAADESPSL